MYELLIHALVGLFTVSIAFYLVACLAQMRRDDTPEKCPYCADVDEPECKHEHPTLSYVCTRPAGHGGDHVACGTKEHSIKRWAGRR